MPPPSPSARPEALLTSLAILKVNWDEQRQSYIDNFVPFIADVLRLADKSELTVLEVQRGVEASFGITIPQGPLNTILSRAAHRGLLERKDRLIVPRRDGLSDFDVSKQRRELLRRHAALVDRLVAFAQERFGKRYTETEAESALQSYVGEWSLGVGRLARGCGLGRRDRPPLR